VVEEIGVIHGRAKRLYRKDITSAIANSLILTAPEVPRGSTVGTAFLDEVVLVLGGDPGTLKSTYRKIEYALATVGEVYDRTRDSSEHLGADGGGTVTNGGYRKLLRGLTGMPQCFILNIADHPVSDEYADIPGESHGFDDDVSGRVALLEAGPGSRVVFYRTRKASETPKQAFIAHAVIAELGPDEGGGYRAALHSYQEFDRPILYRNVALANWNPQHGISEIDYHTLRELVAAGTRETELEAGGLTAHAPMAPAIESAVPGEIADENEAVRILEALLPFDADFELSGRADDFPLELPLTVSEPTAEQTIVLSSGHEAVDGDGRGEGGRRKPRGRARRTLDRYAEKRAIHLAGRYMAAHGWRLHRDCQALGIGYDLEFGKNGVRRHVEVKGIQGSALNFNLTALEWARVLEDPSFMIVAVTGVLFPSTTRVNVLTRDRLVAAQRRPVAYRVQVGE